MFGKNSPDGYSEVLPGIRIKTLNYGAASLMTEFLLTKDAIMPEHSHVHEQSGYLIKGKLKMFIEGTPRILGPGDSWNIASNIKHKVDVVEDSLAVEVFTPRREEYMKFVNPNDITA